MAQLTARIATIFVATRAETRVYHSMEEVPPSLRRKLKECTHGINSATILIADKQGREELVRALRGRPSQVQCRLVETIRARQPEVPVESANTTLLGSVRLWLEMLLPVAAAASLWLLLDGHLF